MKVFFSFKPKSIVSWAIALFTNYRCIIGLSTARAIWKTLIGIIRRKKLRKMISHTGIIFKDYIIEVDNKYGIVIRKNTEDNWKDVDVEFIDVPFPEDKVINRLFEAFSMEYEYLKEKRRFFAYDFGDIMSYIFPSLFRGSRKAFICSEFVQFMLGIDGIDTECKPITPVELFYILQEKA